jgi:hypothetical protein
MRPGETSMLMKSYSVHFRFSQHFNFPAEEAYKWCTDYDSGDIRLAGDRGSRAVRRINEDTLILTDTYLTDKGKVARKKLVRLYPEIYSWTNTRISAEGRFSQFLYQIIPEAEGSRLEFRGSQVIPGKKPPAPKLAALARKTVKEDLQSWRNLAMAMEEDLGGRSKPNKQRR